MKKDKEPFLIYASPAILAIGIMGFLLYFEVDYLDIGFSALGYGEWLDYGTLRGTRRSRWKNLFYN